MMGLLLAAALSVAPARVPEQTLVYIQSLKPEIKPWYGRRLSKLIDYWAKYYDLDPDMLVVIIRLESYFEPDTLACWPAPWKGKGQTTCDHGLAQINEVWIQEWKLDAQKLIHDDAYNISTAARLLAKLKAAYGQEKGWYGRYHSNIPDQRAWYLSRLVDYGYIE